MASNSPIPIEGFRPSPSVGTNINNANVTTGSGSVRNSRSTSPTATRGRDDIESFGNGVASSSHHEKENNSGQPGNDGPELQDQTNLLPPGQILIVFVGLSACIMLTFFEQTIVATALPIISDYFSSGRTSTWVATAYLLGQTACQPTWGRLSDIFGRKVIIIIALAFFLIWSLACALAQSMTQLIVFRALQGIGGGALLTLVYIIMGDVVALKSRGKYQGLFEILSAISNGSGPVIGGVLSHSPGWRWCFWINLPIGGLAIVLIIFLLPLRRVRGNVMKKLKDIDYLGTFLTLLGSVLLLLPLNWGGVFYSWSSPQVITLLVVSALVIAAFVFWEWRGARLPIIPMHIFKARTLVGAYIATFFNGVILYDLLYYLPQFFQISRGFSATKSGFLIFPLLVIITMTVIISGQYTSYTGRYRIPIYVGYVLLAVGLGLMTTITTHTSVGIILGYTIIAACFGATMQTTFVAAQAAVGREDMAVVTSGRNFVRSVGAVVGLAIGSAIINNTLRKAVNQLGLSQEVLERVLDRPTSIASDPDLSPSSRTFLINGYTKGFQHAFLFCTICGLLGFLASVCLIQHHELIRKGDDELKKASKAWLDSKKNKQGKNGHDSEEVSDVIRSKEIEVGKEENEHGWEENEGAELEEIAEDGREKDDGISEHHDGEKDDGIDETHPSEKDGGIVEHLHNDKDEKVAKLHHG